MNNKDIVVLSSSIREGRKTHTIAEFVVQKLQHREGVNVTLIDLKEVNLPLFNCVIDESNYPDNLKQFSDAVVKANGIITVCPEYKTVFQGF